MSVSRRVLLQRGGLVAAVLLVAGGLPGEEPGRAQLASGTFPGFPDIIRPEDQVVLKVGTGGFDLVQNNGVALLKARPGTSELIVVMAPQHVMEWDVSPPKAPSKPIHARWTELRFAVPAGLTFPATTAGILGALRNLPLVTHTIAGTVDTLDVPSAAATLVPAAELLRTAMAPSHDRSDAYLVDAARRGAAQAGAAPGVRYPEGARFSAADGVPIMPTTELLVSSRLVIVPPGGSTRFTHATEPARQGGQYAELWGTRLAVLSTDGGRVEMPLMTRAVRAHDATGSGTWAGDTGPAKLSAPTINDAKAIVTQNTTFNANDPQQVEDTALHAAHLHLSPRLGGSVRLAGDWDGKSVATFRHRTSTGRDTYSRIATAGRMYPLGHKAVRTETVERVFSANGLNGEPAVLRRRVTITVQQRVKNFGLRTWPFTSVELLADETPEGQSKFLYSDAEYISVNGTPFEFPCRGIDHAGDAVEFAMPLVFVPNTFQPADYSQLAGKYNGSALSRVFLGHVTVAEPAPGQPDGVVRAPGAAEVIAEVLIGATAEKAFKPSVTQFDGRIPALGHLSDQGTSMTFRYAGQYTSSGFGDGNAGEVVLALDSALAVALTDGADAGGLLGPVSTAVTGMSRRLGAVAGPLDTAAAGTFKPAEFLGATALAELKLFGLFPLGALIPASGGFAAAPTITGKTIDGLRNQTFSWTTPLFPNGGEIKLAGAALRPLPDAPAPVLTVRSELSIGSDNVPHQRTECEVSNVQLAIGLFGAELVRLPVPSIRFVSVDAEKPTVDVGLGGVEFAGVLAFISRLADLIGGSGFSGGRSAGSAAKSAALFGDGPSIDVTPDGVRSSFSLAVPSVAIGMFSLENITFGAALDLPFDGSPRFTFNFGTYDNRFGLFVSALGGGGYIALGLSVDKGLDLLEGVLEFGAQIRIDLKLVEGKVSVMGGVYFKIADGATTLTGYLSINGEVSVLSIVTLGVCQTLSLTYSGGKVRGEAELVFYVSTFFFSKTVRRKFSRTFAGSNGDPTFAELMAPAGYPGPRPWDTYCKAFL